MATLVTKSAISGDISLCSASGRRKKVRRGAGSSDVGSCFRCSGRVLLAHPHAPVVHNGAIELESFLLAHGCLRVSVWRGVLPATMPHTRLLRELAGSRLCVWPAAHSGEQDASGTASCNQGNNTHSIGRGALMCSVPSVCLRGEDECVSLEGRQLQSGCQDATFTFETPSSLQPATLVARTERRWSGWGLLSSCPPRPSGFDPRLIRGPMLPQRTERTCTLSATPAARIMLSHLTPGPGGTEAEKAQREHFMKQEAGDAT